MDKLSYTKSLWAMTDDQVEDEYLHKRNWKNTDEYALYQLVERERMNRLHRKEQKEKQIKEEERIRMLVQEYSGILNRWAEQGMTKKDGIYYYKGQIMFWLLGGKHIDDLLVEVKSIDEKFQKMLMDEKITG